MKQKLTAVELYDIERRATRVHDGRWPGREVEVAVVLLPEDFRRLIDGALATLESERETRRVTNAPR